MELKKMEQEQVKAEPVLSEQEQTGSPYLLPSSMSPCTSGECPSGNSSANVTKCQSENKSLCIKTTEGETITFPESFQYCVVKQEPQDWDESQTNNPNRQILLWKKGYSGDKSIPVHFMEGQNEQTFKSVESVSDSFGTKLVNPQETISFMVSLENLKTKEQPRNPCNSSFRESGNTVRGNEPKENSPVQPIVLYLQTVSLQRETKLKSKTNLDSINPVERNDGFTKFRLNRPYPSTQINKQDVSDLERPFPCKLCGKRYKLKPSLKQHLKIHTGDSPFQCNLCEKWFVTKGVLHRDLMTHSGEKPQKTTESETITFPSMAYLENCQTKEQPGDLCNSSFTESGNTGRGNEPEENSSVQPIRPYPSSQSNEQDIPDLEKPFDCELCGRRFESNSNLKRHMKTHTGYRPFQCNLCEKRIFRKSVLCNHIMPHSWESSQKTTEGETIASQSMVSLENCQTKEQSGDRCNSSFAESGNTVRDNEPKENSSVQPTGQDLQTEQPQRKTKLKSKTINVDDSINPVERNLGFQLIRPYPSSQSNEQSIPDLERPFPCKLCGRRFKLKSNLKQHLKTHTGYRPFQCNLCEKRFVRKSVLHNHMMTHSGESSQKTTESETTAPRSMVSLLFPDPGKPFSCILCGKRFKMKHGLKEHLKIHTDDRPFQWVT